jgi:hypothetical protein
MPTLYETELLRALAQSGFGAAAAAPTQPLLQIAGPGALVWPEGASDGDDSEAEVFPTLMAEEDDVQELLLYP